MKRKIRNVCWIILLLCCSFPVGYRYQVVYNKMLVYSEMTLNFITGGIGIILTFGLISFITYKVLKKREIGKDPSKVALLIYTILLIIFALMFLPYYQDAVYEHRLLRFIENANY